MRTQGKSATGVCTTLGELRRQIDHGRRVLGAAARAEGARLLSDHRTCGCHVHVGVPDRDTAAAVVNHLRQ